MQVLQAGQYKYLLLELDHDLVSGIVKQAGFEFKIQENERGLMLDLDIPNRQTPLLLFDASDPGNLGWFSRCTFYVDGNTGRVLQTPLTVANVRDTRGRSSPQAVRVQIAKELPAGFRLPGKQPVTEQMVYAVLYNFLQALVNVGVGICGGSVVKPLAGRSEIVGPRN
jgi:hypothetical protein